MATTPSDEVRASRSSATRDDARGAVAEVVLPWPGAFWRRLDALDVFAALNGFLFVLMCAFAYHDRWNAYMGSGRTAEFVFYAAVILAAIAATRSLVPRRPFAPWVLVLLQIGIIAHFAGGLVHFGGMRLYDHLFAGIRFDKFVHGFNAFVAGLAVLEVCRASRLPIVGFTRCLAFFAVLGLGALVEISEFVVTRTLREHGVGGYLDTAGDLVANACGGLLFLSFGGWLERRFESRPTPPGQRCP